MACKFSLGTKLEDQELKLFISKDVTSTLALLPFWRLGNLSKATEPPSNSPLNKKAKKK